MVISQISIDPRQLLQTLVRW